MLTYIDNRMFRNNLKFVPACGVAVLLRRRLKNLSTHLDLWVAPPKKRKVRKKGWKWMG